MKVLIKYFEGEMIREGILNLSRDEFEELKTEMLGKLPYVKEFKTTDGKIITSDKITKYKVIGGGKTRKKDGFPILLRSLFKVRQGKIRQKNIDLLLNLLCDLIETKRVKLRKKDKILLSNIINEEILNCSKEEYFKVIEPFYDGFEGVRD